MSSPIGRLLGLPSALLLLSVSYTCGSLLEARQTNSNTLPLPISVASEGHWGGIDGDWSLLTLRVGTPPQSVQTLVSTASYQTWVVLPQGCDGAASETECAQSRGGIFNNNSSSSWNQIGIYTFGVESNLDYYGNAIYGHDTVIIEENNNANLTIQNAVVGGFAVDDYYLGLFGINPQSTNFTKSKKGSSSYVSLLKEQGHISSISYGYTAGAKYRSSGVPASLTLGGYESSKFVENDIVFSLASDDSRDILVAIQSISTPSETESSPTGTELLADPCYAYIDSTVPQIWLPVETCQAFEQEFGLTYDSFTQLYLINDTLHQTLLERNPSVTFSLGQGLSNGPRVQIKLPYSAFDLTALPPYQGLANQSYYFPLRRAENSTQYTLGRTFLQEAYLSVDYESAQFNVSQCSWEQASHQRLVTIPPQNDDGSDSNSVPVSGSNTGSIAGIAAGIVAAVSLVGIFLLWKFRPKHQPREATEEEEKGSEDESKSPTEQHTSTHPPQIGVVRTTSTSSAHMRHLSAFSATSTIPPRTPTSRTASPISPGDSPAKLLKDVNPHSKSQTRHTSMPPLPTTSSRLNASLQPVYEMPGDMPEVVKKEGRSQQARRFRHSTGPAHASRIPLNQPPRSFQRGSKQGLPRNSQGIARPMSQPTSRPRAFSFEMPGDSDQLSRE